MVCKIHYFCSMKKIFVVTMAALLAAVGTVCPQSLKAQEADQPLQRSRVVTNGLLDNWFLQGGLQWNENGVWKPFQGKLALGKWWSPTIGTRIALTGWQGNHYAIDWSRVPMDDYVITEKDYQRKNHSYFTLSGDVMFSLSNIFMGYNEERLWNLLPFVGVGVSRNCYANSYAMGLDFGLLNTLRLNKRLAVNLELGWQRVEPSFIDKECVPSQWGNHARRFYAEVGLTIGLGKQTGWQKAPDVEAVRLSYEAEIEALNAQLEDANAEIDRLTNGGAEE